MRSQFPAFPVVIVNKAFDLQPRRFAPSVNVKAIQRLSCKKRQLTLSSDSHNVFTQKAQLHRTAPDGLIPWAPARVSYYAPL
jgi:hypothetical protein